jgi:uracil-DNA glycosylase family 4
MASDNAELNEVMADLRRHLAWQESEGPKALLDTREAVEAARVAAVQAPAPARAPGARPALVPQAATPRPVGAAAPVVDRPAAAPIAARPAAAPITARPAVAPVAVPVAPASGEHRTLDEVRRELGDCQRCKLCSTRKNIVFGVGNPRAELVFVGEGPGADEDDQGIPFVGKAGQLLTKMIEAMGFQRDDVYICNVVKCRPPGNRNPEPDEIEACEPFLKAQLASIQPKAIVALGKFAAQTLLRDATPITRMRGKWREYEGIPLMPTFHPAYLLRQPQEKKIAWTDLQQVMAVFGKTAGPK